MLNLKVRFGIGVGEHVALVGDEEGVEDEEDVEDDVVSCVLVFDEDALMLEVDDFFASGDMVGDAEAPTKRLG